MLCCDLSFKIIACAVEAIGLQGDKTGDRQTRWEPITASRGEIGGLK